MELELTRDQQYRLAAIDRTTLGFGETTACLLATS
jgi:hypothetical protein